MKCPILFSGKNKKNIINLSSANLAQILVKVKFESCVSFLPWKIELLGYMQKMMAQIKISVCSVHYCLASLMLSKLGKNFINIILKYWSYIFQ